MHSKVEPMQGAAMATSAMRTVVFLLAGKLDFGKINRHAA
jgi:hypothetical protein